MHGLGNEACFQFLLSAVRALDRSLLLSTNRPKKL
jgi:hypothetical protein